MADSNGKGLDSLFELSSRRRLEHLAGMLERNRHRRPSAMRFALAGVLTALDGDLVGKAGDAVAAVLRAKIAELPDEGD
jgi:hypothetical protein